MMILCKEKGCNQEVNNVDLRFSLCPEHYASFKESRSLVGRGYKMKSFWCRYKIDMNKGERND